MNTAEFKNRLENETGLKFTVSKMPGSMKNYLQFTVKKVKGTRELIPLEVVKNILQETKVKLFYSQYSIEVLINSFSEQAPAPAETLTAENAARVSTVISKLNPEHGTKKFTFDHSGDGLHTQGAGSNSGLLFEQEFRFWNVATWK